MKCPERGLILPANTAQPSWLRNLCRSVCTCHLHQGPCLWVANPHTHTGSQSHPALGQQLLLCQTTNNSLTVMSEPHSKSLDASAVLALGNPGGNIRARAHTHTHTILSSCISVLQNAIFFHFSLTFCFSSLRNFGYLP